MHCPKCGFVIDSEEVSFCSRCGLTLGKVRAAVADADVEDADPAISGRGVNLGVTLMFGGALAALATVMAWPASVPIAAVMLFAIYAAINLGSGNILKMFHSGTPSDESVRSYRQEMAFGSTLMLISTLLASFLVAVVPVYLIRVSFLTFIPAAFLLLLITGRSLFRAYRNLVSDSKENDMRGKHPAETLELVSSLATGELDSPAEQFGVFAPPIRKAEFAESPPSITEGTTRLLDEERKG